MARKVIPTEKLSEQYGKHFFDAVNGQSDLACVLVATAFIENALLTLISKLFANKGSTADGLLKPGNALGDLSKSAAMAYCLGFINTAMLNNINLIGEIRNTFAHSHELIDFAHPDLKERASKLTLPKITQGYQPTENEPISIMTKSPRGRFSWVSMNLFIWITFSAMEIQPLKPHARDNLW